MLISSCHITGQASTGQNKHLNKLWDSLDMASSHHTGLTIYDPKKNKFIFNYRDDNFFTPASNIKLFTLYAALITLDEFVPAAYYQIKGDSMIVWGGGDPGTKFPSIKDPSPFVEFLKATDKKIVFSGHHFQTERFGWGWAWDDFPYRYQSERTAFPIYGNRLWIERFRDSIIVTPAYFEVVTTMQKSSTQKFTRNEAGTEYSYLFDPRTNYSLLSIPVSLFPNDMRSIWREAIGKEITWKNYPISHPTLQIAGTSRDSLLRLMMKESDNFTADQLLLACALKIKGVLNEKELIRTILNSTLSDITDSIKWVDGSGLSRYNLLTPRSVIMVLEKIINDKGLDYVKSIFPSGGESGTTLGAYRNNKGEPYIFAKTGTMRNVYCLSGVLITRKGDVLLFSWMNNHFAEKTIEIQKSMEKLFVFLRDHY